MMDLAELIRLAQAGDGQASEKILQENIGLVWSVARRFLGRGTDLDDLFQLGCLGLMKAVEGFDSTYGTQFSTYAVPKIAGEIRRFLRDDGTVKVSRTLKEQAAAIRNARNTLSASLGRDPSISEISQIVHLSPEEIAEAENAVSATESIHKKTGEDGFTLEHILTDTETEERMVEKVALRQAIAGLPERERRVIQLRYYHSLTQQRAAAVLNISQVQVSRIEKKALQMLRSQLS